MNLFASWCITGGFACMWEVCTTCYHKTCLMIPKILVQVVILVVFWRQLFQMLVRSLNTPTEVLKDFPQQLQALWLGHDCILPLLLSSVLIFIQTEDIKSELLRVCLNKSQVIKEKYTTLLTFWCCKPTLSLFFTITTKANFSIGWQTLDSYLGIEPRTSGSVVRNSDH
jgi:hypothetical protein